MKPAAQPKTDVYVVAIGTLDQVDPKLIASRALRAAIRNLTEPKKSGPTAFANFVS
jgi:hypothetical protein